MDSEATLSNIQILGSSAIQSPAQQLVDSLSRSYHELDIALDLTFRNGRTYTSRGKSLADLPNEPVSLTYELFNDVDKKRKAFLSAARSDLAPPDA
jgi:hypothetical protein